jgi:hypothetical protein
MKKKWFYEKNEKFLKSDVNKTFEEILWMTDTQFNDWSSELIESILFYWDVEGIPPRVGQFESDIISEFKKIRSYPVNNMECVDEETGLRDCIRNTSSLGNCINQWFPTMYATKINYSNNPNKAQSIYDQFKDPILSKRMCGFLKRQLKRDSFYYYSTPLKHIQNLSPSEYTKRFFTEPKDSAIEWIKYYESNRESFEREFDYWLCPHNPKLENYTGFQNSVKSEKIIILKRDEFKNIQSIISEKCKSNISVNEDVDYQIRVFKKTQKLFPFAFTCFRLSASTQYPVNFSPIIAKYLYEKYTEHIKTQEQITIYDPSLGWGGRLIGALSIENENRRIHYVGTDPNKDHNTENGRTKYHELADFYNKHTNTIFFDQHTYHIFQNGAEEIRNNLDFQKYKGKLDLIFTSPPYFAKEVYSQDSSQSCIKFNKFDDWVNGFLKPTLETCVEYLKNDRYLLWNIADVKFGNTVLPLQQISCDILKELGMEYCTTLKMCITPAPGSNRVCPKTGKPLARNFCKIKESKKGTKIQNKEFWYKYEPILVFRKI